MAPAGWTKPPILEWLNGRLPEYVKRRADNKIHLCWAPMYEDYFKRFPAQAELGLPLPTDVNARQLTAEEEDTLSTALEKRKKQLENWFRNTRKKTDSADAISAKTLSIILRLLQLQGKGKRAHRPVEVFQLRNRDIVKEALTAAGYDELLAENIEDDEDDWTDETEDTPAARSKKKKSVLMQLRTRVIARLFAAATEEERSAVEAAVEEEKKQLVEAKESGAKAITSIWSMLEGIDSIETAMVYIHKALYEATRWVGFTVVGGPHPRLQGQLSLKVICHGRTPMGNDFEDVCVDFDDKVLKPFQDFLRLVFSPSDCAGFQLPTTASPTSDSSTAPPAELSASEPAVHRILPPTEPAFASAASAKKAKPKKTKKTKKTAPKSSPTVTEKDDDTPPPREAAVDPAHSVPASRDTHDAATPEGTETAAEGTEKSSNGDSLQDETNFGPWANWSDLRHEDGNGFTGLDFASDNFGAEPVLGGSADDLVDMGLESSVRRPDDHGFRPPRLWLPQGDSPEPHSPDETPMTPLASLGVDAFDFTLSPSADFSPTLASPTTAPSVLPASENIPAPTTSSFSPPTGSAFASSSAAGMATSSSSTFVEASAASAACAPGHAEVVASSPANGFLENYVSGSAANGFLKNHLAASGASAFRPSALFSAFTPPTRKPPAPRPIFGTAARAPNRPTLAASIALAAIAPSAPSPSVSDTSSALPLTPSSRTNDTTATSSSPTSPSSTQPAVPTPPTTVPDAPADSDAVVPPSRLPITRPATRPPVAPASHPAASKAPKPSATRGAAQKEEDARRAAEAAKKVEAVETRKRGRPRKVVLDETTNQSAVSDVPNPFGEGRMTVTVCHPTGGPTNRDRARAAAAEEKAEEKRKKAAAAAAQRAEEKRRGFTERIVNGATVVTMIGKKVDELPTSSRGRALKRATYRDGTKIPDNPVVKNTRAAAATASNNKRKAADAGGKGASKR
ncbi:hypothetical protein R3P38DRAFT_3180137 [Favolaschia claudopus]|uniref:Uncharacterized protein n=1 Tax=Favolaschia claudopus TaxID=2862362 RepID=A0AAW0CQ20_9AGAR